MSHLVNADGLNTSAAVDKAIIVQAVMTEHGADVKTKKGEVVSRFSTELDSTA
jgi:hypothetical protein